MSKIFKPMLAAEADLDKLLFPILVSAKLDGIRAIVRDGVVYSRRNKPIPNKYVQQLYGHLNHYDGELIVGSPTAKDVYRRTLSAVMSNDETGGDARFYVFDHIKNPHWPYKERVEELTGGDAYLHKNIHVFNMDELLKVEEQMLEKGYEGLILRDAIAPYKNGRSTVREGYLLKLKRFVDGEFEIIGFEERMHNGNELQANEMGGTTRSSHKENKHGRGDLGALILSFPGGGEFNCGTGFTDKERSEIWRSRKDYLGRMAKVKYFPIGMKEKPRHPVWLGLRDEKDM
jgi:DNA ligase 1